MLIISKRRATSKITNRKPPAMAVSSTRKPPRVNDNSEDEGKVEDSVRGGRGG